MIVAGSLCFFGVLSLWIFCSGIRQRAQLECGSQRCIPSSWDCDGQCGQDDCGDNSDERGCHTEDVLSSLEEASANSTSNNSVADTNSTTAHGGSRNPVHEPPSDAGSEASNSSTAVTGRYLLGSSHAYNAVGADCTSQLQQVGSLPIVDGIAPEFLARHTIDKGVLDSVYQSAVTGNGITQWNGEQGGALNINPEYPVHLASNGGIPHGYVWNQSRFQADSSACPTHVHDVRQPVPTATVTMPSQLCAWNNTLEPVGLIQTSCHGSNANYASTAVTESYLSGVNPAHTAVATSSNSSLQASSDVSPRLVRLSTGALDWDRLDATPTHFQHSLAGSFPRNHNGSTAGGIAADFSASQSQGNCTFEQVLRERDRELHERRIKTMEELIRKQRARKNREQREMQEIESPQLQQLHTARKSPIQNCLSCEICVEVEQQDNHQCEPDNCSICLEPVDDFIGNHELPCQHKVHLDCYIRMLQEDLRTCPVCRHPIH